MYGLDQVVWYYVQVYCYCLDPYDEYQYRNNDTLRTKMGCTGCAGVSRIVLILISGDTRSRLRIEKETEKEIEEKHQPTLWERHPVGCLSIRLKERKRERERENN